jgi:hypothetical protein
MASVSDYGTRAVRISVHSTVLGLACVVLRSYDAITESRFCLFVFESIFRVSLRVYNFVHLFRPVSSLTVIICGCSFQQRGRVVW